jgi:hypothetical protein
MNKYVLLKEVFLVFLIIIRLKIVAFIFKQYICIFILTKFTYDTDFIFIPSTCNAID